MARLGRPGLSDLAKEEVWRRWKRGESLSEIGRVLGKHPGSIHGLLSLSGGIRPKARRRSIRSLSMEEREEISRGVAAGLSMRTIARSIGRAPSTISRELARNRGRQGYRASHADERAWDRARRPRSCRLESKPRLRRIVVKKLRDDWSPEQISGWLSLTYSDAPSMQLSHEAIYRALYRRNRVLDKRLLKHLRTRRSMRRSRRSSTAGQTRGQIVDAIPIHERPSEVETREVAGHWEGDLIAGSRNTHIATLVERCSRFTLLVKVAGKDTKSVVSAVAKTLTKLPAALRRSLTWDRGTEMADHPRLTDATGMPVYFCDPQSPWQRGTNENTNRLLRQYFPKGTQLDQHTQAGLSKVARKLNRRPRKTLGYRCPEEAVKAVVALTG